MTEVTETVAVAEEAVTYGIKETKEVIKFGIDMGEALDKAMADGKVGLDDAMYFFNAVMGLGDAFGDIKLVAKELGDLDAAERAELIAYVESEFDISNDKVELVIEKSIATAMAVYDLVMLFKGGLKKA